MQCFFTKKFDRAYIITYLCSTIQSDSLIHEANLVKSLAKIWPSFSEDVSSLGAVREEAGGGGGGGAQAS